MLCVVHGVLVHGLRRRPSKRLVAISPAKRGALVTRILRWLGEDTSIPRGLLMLFMVSGALSALSLLLRIAS